MAEPTFTREELEEHAAGADSTMCGPSFRHCLAKFALALLDRAEAAERERSEWRRRWGEENANLDAVIADYAAKLAARDRTIAERDKSLAELRAELDETRRDIEDYDYLLQLQPLRELVEKWRAEKGKPDTMPDYGEMIRWIVDRAEAAEARLAEQATRIAELEDVLGWDKGRACACWREPGSDPDGPFNECAMHAGIRAALADARRDAERLRRLVRAAASQLGDHLRSKDAVPSPLACESCARLVREMEAALAQPATREGA